MPHVKEYVTFVREDGTEAQARVLSKREHQVFKKGMKGDTVDVTLLDLKVFGDPVETHKGCREGTKPGCWHE